MRTKPNILFIMADQMAGPVLPLYGHNIVKTPNIERIAENGTLFESAYCNNPICASSRFSMMSGQLSSHIGAYDNAAEFPASVTTFAHYLRGLGYRTCLSGKMHFVGPDQLHGFNERLTTDIYPSDFGWTPNWLDQTYPYSPSGMSMRSVVEAGIAERTLQLDYDDEAAHQAVQKLYDFARTTKDGPFMLLASFTHPHNPFTTSGEYWRRYRHDDIDMPKVPFIPVEQRDPWSQRCYYLIRQDEHRVTDNEIRNARHAYYGMCSYVDDLVGRLLDTLEVTGLDRDTIVIFTADHGEMMGERGSWYKFSPFEWSSRVPLVIRLPGKKGGRRESMNVSLVDLLPTLLDFASEGKQPRLYEPIDGHSMANMLDGPDSSWPDEALIEYTAEGTYAPGLFLRKGRYKYVYCETDSGLLFDLKADPLELDNVHNSPEHAAAKDELLAEIFRRWNPGELKETIIASQQKRLFLQSVLMKGEYFHWDFQPFRDASRQFVRSATVNNPTSIKGSARLPYVAPTPPDFPRRAS